MDTGPGSSDMQCAGPDSPNSTDDSGWIDFASELISSCTDSVAKSNGLPTQSDYTYYDAFPDFRLEITRLQSTLLSSIAHLINAIDKDNEFHKATNDINRFQNLTEATDMALERVDIIIDQRSLPTNAVTTKTTNETQAAKQSHRSLQIRPQTQFKVPVDNSSAPWRPVLNLPLPNHHTSLNVKKQDPVPPSPKLGAEMMSHIESLGVNVNNIVPHPYKGELEHLAFSEDSLRPRAERLYKSLEDTEYTWIDTEQGLQQLADVLSNEREFAVDLEHHSFRSYLGFTCLMQISTRSQDYIIDTIQLRHCMGLLLDPFTNPDIVKVFHGADFDIFWLQKDFSLFVVNMFDTGQAARVLQLPSLSLKFLLDHYCDVQASKIFQRADWRLRPIPAAMIKYARSDTHYLLYIYDRMCNQLSEQSTGSLLSVFKKSRDICLKMFEKPICDSESYMRLIQQFGLVLDHRQEAVLRDLYSWRDALSREVDESCGYIMPNATLISICKAVPLDQKSLLELVPNLSSPVRGRVADVLDCITKALVTKSPTPKTLPALEIMHNTANSSPAIAVAIAEAQRTSISPEQSSPLILQLPKQSAVSIELSHRSSSRMFDSDSDGDSDGEDIRAAEAVKLRILQSLPPITASVMDAPPQNVQVSQMVEISTSSEASPEKIRIPDNHDETESVDVSIPEKESRESVCTSGDKNDNEDADVVPLSLNEMRYGHSRKRKPQQTAESARISNVEPFDYEKAMQSAAANSNDAEQKESFDFFRGPARNKKAKKHGKKR